MPFYSRKSKPPLRQPKSDIADQAVAFRRSRTITGTSSSNIRSANEPKSQLKSPRLKEHELKHHRRLLSLGIIGLAGLSGLCVWLLDQYIVTIDTMTSTHTLARPLVVNDYQSAIRDYLNARPAERFRFMLNTDRLNTYVKENNAEVSNIEISGGTGLVAANATVSLRAAVAVWQVNSVKYYVDASGEIYQKNYYQEPVVSVKDESGVTPKTTELIASTRLLRFLGQTVSGLNAAGIGTVTSVTIPGGTLRQLDIALDTRPYRIKTHMDRDAVGQVADAVAALRYLDSKQIIPEYVDVRVSGKAFYR
ncbi:hypothetical protein H7Y40_03060 [Pedobacter sp.]|nr:hypothetical protein [Candidatus Saccharibacteria bacterium]